MSKRRVGGRSKVRRPRPKAAPVKDQATEELVSKLRDVVEPPGPRGAAALLSADQPNPPKVVK